ncbi:hypothetical protein LCGC14_0538640 [marine sediment metagenome]|uniref:Uncharacterized protein n=1 Tax=marine sediment metagenome TaxID=412755 RepID=A0A0F9RY74_9ZZZZ
MKIETRTFIDCSILYPMGAVSFRRVSEREIVWQIAGKIKDDILCITMVDFGDMEDNIFKTVYTIHTKDNLCEHKEGRLCDIEIEDMFGTRFGVLSDRPGYLAWEGTNIPFINKLRATPKRVLFPLHGSYVDVPGVELQEAEEVLNA